LDSQKRFMKAALSQAKTGGKRGEIPVGAVIVKDGKIIARAFNQRIEKKDPSAHAEVLALKKAGKKLGTWNLTGCDMYVTLEPCLMCYGACLNARLKNVYFGAYDTKFGIYELAKSGSINFNHTINIEGGILQEDCARTLTEFFANLRAKKLNEKK